jgi:hypothetical protein
MSHRFAPSFPKFVRCLVTLFVTTAVVLPSRAQGVNLEEVGRIAMPPVPPNDGSPADASDIWVTGNFAYVGRFDNAPSRVEV